MKKKILGIILGLLTTFVFAEGYVHTCHSVQCAKCKELAEKNAGIQKQIAWRTYIYKKENGKVYAIYRCAGGHEYWAEIK